MIPMENKPMGPSMEEAEPEAPDTMDAVLNLVRRALAQDLMRAISEPKVETTPETEVSDESANGNG